MEKKDFYFTMDNTEGYNQKQLDELNVRVDDWFEVEGITDIDQYYDYIVSQMEKIQEAYDTEASTVTKLTAKETIKLMRKAIINYVADLPDRQISTGYYVKTVGTKYVHTVNTWDGSRIFKESIPSFYGGAIPNRYKIVQNKKVRIARVEKKLTAKEFVRGQLPVDYHLDSGFSVEYGRFAESTIRKAINELGYSSKMDECGNMFAVSNK